MAHRASSMAQPPGRTGGHRWHIRFWLSHLAGLAAFSALWYAAVVTSLSVRSSLTAGRFVPALLLGPALHWHLLAGTMLYGTLAGVLYSIQFALRLREEEAHTARAESARLEAELHALRARLNPHFLFNTLNSVAMLSRRGGDAAEDALERLGDMLRYVLRTNRDALDDVSLAEEWAFVEDYLALEQLRLGERLCVESHMEPETFSVRIPVLTLQPLVENAIRHAISPSVSGGTITISSNIMAHGADRVLELVVSDTGRAGSPAPATTDSHGIGLDIVRRRLDTLYGSGADLTLDMVNGEGCRAVIRVPVNGRGNQRSHRRAPGQVGGAHLTTHA